MRIKNYKIKELLTTDKERERSDKVKYEEFNLLTLYKAKLNKLKVPYTIADTINTAFKVELVKEFPSRFLSNRRV